MFSDIDCILVRTVYVDDTRARSHIYEYKLHLSTSTTYSRTYVYTYRRVGTYEYYVCMYVCMYIYIYSNVQCTRTRTK